MQLCMYIGAGKFLPNEVMCAHLCYIYCKYGIFDPKLYAASILFTEI